MSINDYIESLTKIDRTKTVENVEWSKLDQEKNRSTAYSLRGKGEIPYQLEFNQAYQNTSYQKDKKYYCKKKTSSYETYNDSRAKYGEHRFADIVPSVREVGGGYNTFSNNAIEKRFKENQSKYASTEKSESNTTYVTATSKSTEESYNSAFENLNSIELSNGEFKSEVSISDMSEKSEKRYKKNALMTGLLQTQCKELSDIDTSNEKSSGTFNKPPDIGNDKKVWDDESDELMYKRRITRFFQSAEDEDVYVHPLKEQIQKDPEWQKFRLRRKGVEVIQTPRQYYLNVDDESFNFQPRKSE